MNLKWHEMLGSETDLVFRDFLNQHYNAWLPMDNLPVWTELYLKLTRDWQKITFNEVQKQVFEEIWVSQKNARLQFEVDLYSEVNDLKSAVRAWDAWVLRLVSMWKHNLSRILDENVWLTDEEKEELRSRNELSGSWMLLKDFNLTNTQSRLLTDFVLWWYPEWYSDKIEKALSKSEEFARAYKFILQERFFSESYTASNTKTSAVHQWHNSSNARGVDWNAREWVTYH